MKKRLALALCIILLSGVFLGCRKGNDDLLNFAKPKSGDTVATLETTMGNIKIMFFKEVAPKAVENFITHAKDGYFNNVSFHRVIENFMIQGGDPKGTGSGGESIWGTGFANEVSDRARNFRGALSMANTGQPNSNGSQFFIVQAGTAAVDDNSFTQAESNFGTKFSQAVIDKYKEVGGYPSLDGGYTVFGQVIEGMDVVDKIAAVKTNKDDRPLTPVLINKIDLETVK